MSSESTVRVIRVGPLEKHPNADTLSITQVDGGYPVIVRTGELAEGDLAVYIPVDSVVPDIERWAFLQGHRRIKAKKLRGVFSMGLLVPACKASVMDRGAFGEQGFWVKDERWTCDGGHDRHPDLVEGDDVGLLYGVTKYEPAMKSFVVHSDCVSDPGFFPKYTDVEGLRKHGSVLKPGEEVLVHEKIHGMNARWGWHAGEFWAGSHNHFKKRPDEGQTADVWWRVAAERKLEELLRPFSGLLFFGEVFGKGVQDLHYGAIGLEVAFFDVFSVETGAFLSADDMQAKLHEVGLPEAPVLFRGPWSDELRTLSEGPTTLGGGPHVREGFVVRPVVERYEKMCGRAILKLHGQGYLLRKEG